MNASLPYLSEFFRFYLLIALLIAAWTKTVGFAKFRSNLSQSFAWPNSVVATVAAAVVIAEWSVAALMAYPGTAFDIGATSALALFSLFTAVIAWSLIFNRKLICNCFGASTTHRTSAHDLARNFLFVAASVFLVAQHAALAGTRAAIGEIELMILAGLASIAFMVSTTMHEVSALLQLPSDV